MDTRDSSVSAGLLVAFSGSSIVAVDGSETPGAPATWLERHPCLEEDSRLKIDCLTFSMSSESFCNLILTSDNCSFEFSLEVFLGRHLGEVRQEQQQAGGGGGGDVQQGLHEAGRGPHGQCRCWDLWE